MTQIFNIDDPLENPLALKLQSAVIQDKPRLRAPDAKRYLAEIGLVRWETIDRLCDAIESHNYVVVESGHATGKTISAAGVVSWWMETKGPKAKVVTIAPTFMQVNNILWRYIRSIDKSEKLLGTIFDGNPRWDIEPDWHAVGLSPRKDSAEALQNLHGYHSPNLLVVLDEAPALPRVLWEAVMGLVTGAGNKILALGNPLEQNGPFWDACNSSNWYHIQISCLDHPNVKTKSDKVPGAVSWEWVNTMVEQHCLRIDAPEPGSIVWPLNSNNHYRPSPVFQTRVLGQAPESSTDQLISMRWLNHARQNDEPPDRIIVLGLDPARYGGDEAALVARAGNKILWIKRHRPTTSNPSIELAGWLQEEMYSLQAKRAFIDESGIGAGVLDVARNFGLPVLGVHFGSGPSQKTRFANLRAESYWRLREWLQNGDCDIPDDDILMGDLAAPKYWYDTTGRILLEPKDDIRKRLGRSPDSGDALALTFALPDVNPLTPEQRISIVQRTPSTWHNPTRSQPFTKPHTSSRWKRRS